MMMIACLIRVREQFENTNEKIISCLANVFVYLKLRALLPHGSVAGNNKYELLCVIIVERR